MHNYIDPEFLVTQPFQKTDLIKENGKPVLRDISTALSVGLPIIGNLIASDNQSSAISDAGQLQANAAEKGYASQLQMFREQLANQMAKYNQNRIDLSSLFGGSNQNLTSTPNAGVMTGTPAPASQPNPFMDQATWGKNNFANIYGRNRGDDEVPTYQNYLQQFRPAFNDNAYLTANPDVASNRAYAGNPWQHYLDYGMKEGRSFYGGAAPTTTQGAPTPNPNTIANAGGLFGAGLPPELAGIFSNLAGASGNAFSEYSKFNPQTMAQDIYDKLTRLGAPQRATDQANLESRLLNQGILTSSQGAGVLGKQQEANNATDLQRQLYGTTQAQAMLDQLLGRATTTAGQATNIFNTNLGQKLQGIGINAGVPINNSNPIPTGDMTVQAAQNQGKANIDAANITNTFWSNLLNNPQVQGGISSLFTPNLTISPTGLGMGSWANTPIKTTGSDSIFSTYNGYGGGV